VDKTAIIFAVTGFSGVASALIYNFLGSTIDAEGYLHEPFFLIPIAYLLLLVGFGGGLLRYCWQIIARHSSKNLQDKK